MLPNLSKLTCQKCEPISVIRQEFSPFLPGVTPTPNFNPVKHIQEEDLTCAICAAFINFPSGGFSLANGDSPEIVDMQKEYDALLDPSQLVEQLPAYYEFGSKEADKIRKKDPKRTQVELLMPGCGHQFHRECLKRWVNVESKNECPICKTNIDPGIVSSLRPPPPAVPSGGASGPVRQRDDSLLQQPPTPPGMGGGGGDEGDARPAPLQIRRMSPTAPSFAAYIERIRPVIQQLRRWSTLDTLSNRNMPSEDYAVVERPELRPIFESVGEIVLSIFDNVYSRLGTFPPASGRNTAYIRWDFAIALVYHLYRVVVRVQGVEEEQEDRASSIRLIRLNILRLRLHLYVNTLCQNCSSRSPDTTLNSEWNSFSANDDTGRMQLVLYKDFSDEVIDDGLNAASTSPTRIIGNLYNRVSQWSETNRMTHRNAFAMISLLYQANRDAEENFLAYTRIVHKLFEIFSDALFPLENRDQMQQDMFLAAEGLFRQYRSYLATPAVNGL